MWRPYFLALRAEAAGAAGQPEDGRRLVAEAQAVMARTDERFYEAELSRLTGVWHLAHSPAAQAEAEAHMRHALEVARHQEAKSLELRAAVSLGRLWQQQGKRIEARKLLAPLYGWFTEGFDTADLQEAKALLEELTGGVLDRRKAPQRCRSSVTAATPLYDVTMHVANLERELKAAIDHFDTSVEWRTPGRAALSSQPATVL